MNLSPRHKKHGSFSGLNAQVDSMQKPVAARALLLTLIWLASCSQPANTPAQVAVEATAPASTPAAKEGSSESETPRILARNVVALRQQVGKQATVYGLIDRTGKSKSGHQFLNFANSEFTATILSPDVGKFVDGAPVDLYANKQVEVTGKVELFKGKVQIRLQEPSQIRLFTPPAPAEIAPVALKELGNNVWLSPAGLRYAGLDPAGLTRVEHVERHCRDIPDRDGPHGVFDGGSGVAFAVIDEAWQTAQENNLRAEREGDRSSYTVNLGRRIGYLGGSTGARRRHPPLEKVFIVFETGTKNVITAFPK